MQTDKPVGMEIKVPTRLMMHPINKQSEAINCIRLNFFTQDTSYIGGLLALIIAHSRRGVNLLKDKRQTTKNRDLPFGMVIEQL